ncbi:MAG TPA: HD domain-containing phosphohydrolase [Candidatus Baltobacteraceae bacterium]|nr:HD domain-containing phosphohydrolase [Candidatus Baltobacteraceae bacterium]
MEPAVRAIDLLSALSLMGDMALGLSAGHGVRSTYIAMCIARELQLSQDEQADLFYAGLLTDAGCTAWASHAAAAILGDDMEARRELFFFTDPTDPREMLKWLTHHIAAGERTGVRLMRVASFSVRGRGFMLEALHNTAEVAARFARRLDRSPRVQEALRFAFERWDGNGPAGKRRDAIPLISRITYAAIFLEVFHGVGGRSAAVDLARTRRGKDLDPVVADAFVHLSRSERFWQGLESESNLAMVREMEPESPFRYFDMQRLDDAASAFGDFADLKSFYSAGHARRVAARCESMAMAMGFDPRNVVTIRRAGLLHDIGLVALPSFVLHKPLASLSEAEWEMMRLHPYHTERILARSSVFSPLCRIVAAHHEQPNGHGYFRGLNEGEIPDGARVLAVADRFDELTHERPGEPALSADEAFGRMKLESGIGLCEHALMALNAALTNAPHDEPAAEPDKMPARVCEPRRVWPAGLTDREVEVLRILATGASRHEIAKRLTVSEHTVRHHLENIYAKIDVHTRVEATLFTIEQGLMA